MSRAFYHSVNFNAHIGKWNVSNVVNMESMFAHSDFNGNIRKWNVGKVLNMSNIFSHTTQFNQNILNWNISNCPNVKNMFYCAKYFHMDTNIGTGTNEINNQNKRRRITK